MDTQVLSTQVSLPCVHHTFQGGDSKDSELCSFDTEVCSVLGSVLKFENPETSLLVLACGA